MSENFKEQQDKTGHPEKEGIEAEKKKAFLRLVEMQEEKVREITQFTFDNPELDYSKEEQEQIQKLENEFRDAIIACGDSAPKFLELMKDRGVGVVENSSFLRNEAQTPLGLIKRAQGQPEGINAAYLTPKTVENFLGKGDLRDSSTEEFTANKADNGLILLHKKPNPKSVFHEGLHAMQYMNEFNMDPKNQEQHAKREIEVSALLIKMREEGLLKEVDRLQYTEGRTALGQFPRYETNDIQRESVQFFANLKIVKESVRQRKEHQSIDDAREEIDGAFSEGDK